MPVSSPLLSSPPPLPSLTTEQGQLEDIPCSFLAQPRHSPGPLIKHKPSSFFCLFLPLFLSLSPPALSPPSICLTSSSPSSVSPSLLFPPATSFHQFTRASLFSRLLPGPSSLAPFAYLSWWRFDIHIGTVFRVNLYKAADLLFSFASVNHAPCDLSRVHFRRMSRSDSAAPF